MGLTRKSIENVLRGSKEEFSGYLKELETALKDSASQAVTEFGELTGSISLGGKSTDISWPMLTQIFTAIGAQTLAIRGSEKSIYGKLFEKFILGSALTILGFSYKNGKKPDSHNMVFWLSERGEKRESDATILIKEGVGVRFDIGFIGPGNTEISLDKVSRFETEMEHGRQMHYMTTIVIVDRIGEGSRITELARGIDGYIVQMSMSYWVKEVAQILSDTTDFHHEILNMSGDESLDYIRNTVDQIDLKLFI